MSACSSNDDDGILGVVDPDVEVPDVDVPDVDVPDVDVPDVDVPDVDAPDVDVPDVDVPDVDAPDVDAPDGDEDPVAGGPDADAPAGSFTITFTNTSDAQPFTPPVVALHNPITADNGIELFVVTQPASGQVIEIAENGNNGPLVEAVQGQIVAGTISAGGPAFPDPENPGPLLPGDSASITLTPSDDTQVLSFVSMVVCTNDGFTGVNSRPLAEETFMAPIYDAGSETNVTMLNYFVPPCNGGVSDNISDEENGAITAHPGQTVAENPAFDFPAGTELLEVTVVAN